MLPFRTIRNSLLSEKVTFRFGWNLVTVYLLSALIQRMLESVSSWPLEAYESSSLLFSMFRSWRGSSGLLLTICLMFLVGKTRWNQHEPGLRIFYLGLAATLTWPFATYQFNFYLGHGHLLERGVLLMLFASCFRWPVLLCPFVWWVGVIAHQFDHPIGYYTWTDKQLVFDLLTLGIVSLGMIRLGKCHHSVPLYLTLVLLAGHYVYPGLAKLWINWPAQNQLSDLLLSSWACGWLNWLTLEELDRWKVLLNRLNLPLICGAMVLELSGLFLISHRRFALASCTLWVLFHLMVCLLSGILFWKWIVVDLLVILWLLFLRTPARESTIPLDETNNSSPSPGGKPENRVPEKSLKNQFADYFPAHHFPLFVALVLLVPFLWGIPFLGWYDTPLVEYYEVELINVHGESWLVPVHLLAPYDVVFAQGRLHFLHDKPILVSTFGATSDLRLVQALQAGNVDDLSELQREHGVIRHNERLAARFRELLRRYLDWIQRAEPEELKPRWWQAPHHVLDGRTDELPRGEIWKGIQIVFRRRFLPEGVLILDEREIIVREIRQ